VRSGLVRGVVVCLALVAGVVGVSDAAAATLPSVTVGVLTLPMTNSAAPHTGLTGTVACGAGTRLTGGGSFLRRVANEPSGTNSALNATQGLVLGGQAPSQGVMASKTSPPPAGATPYDLGVTDGTTGASDWFTDSNFTGAAETGDQFATFGLCATSGGPASTIVKVASTVGANATQVTSPPNLTIATCPAGDTLIGGGAITTTPDQFNDGVTTGNNGNLKPMASYPSNSAGVAAANGSTGATSWSAYGLAGVASATDTVTAFAYCSSDPSTAPVQVARTDVQTVGPQNGGLVDFAAATCPAGTQMIGGGYDVDEQTASGSGFEPQQGWHMVGSFPATDPTGLTEVANGAVNPETWSTELNSGGVGIVSGQAMNQHAFAMCATPAVVPATLSTQASAPVGVGSPISDTATLSGGTLPSGAITFDLYGPGDSGCATVLATSTATVTGDGTYQATPVTATATGTYQWVASYSGDGANPPITGTCNTTGESVVVSAAAPTLTTTAAPALGKTGTALSDTATLSGGDAPTGTIVFSAYQPSQPNCTTAAKTFTVTVTGDGSYASGSFTMTGMVGTYRWIARYSGDANNAATAGTCGASGESSTLVPATTLSSATSGTVVLGSQISDAATLGGGASPTGTMTFKVFGPGDTTCATPLATSTATVSGDGTYNSAPFTTTTFGTYQWIASYGGDANGNAAISGACGASGESDQVTNPPSGASVYVANATNTFGVSQFSIATDGTLSTKNPPVATGIHDNSAALAVTPNGAYVYGVTDQLVNEYVVGAGGTLMPNTQPEIATGSSNANNAEGVAVSPNGTSLYVLNFGVASTVSQYTIAANGTLSAKTVPSVPTGTTPSSIVVSPNGQYAYVTNGNGITQYTIAADGSLSPNPDAASVASAAGIETAGAAESANGENVYINNFTQGTVSQYTVNPDGTLTLAATVATGSRPTATALSPDGTSLYVANGTSPTGSISQYNVSPSGALSPKSPATVTTTGGSDPSAIAISSDGHDLFTANFGFPATASQFTIGVGGLLTADSTPTVATGSQSEGIVATPGPSVSSTASASVPVGGQISDSAILAGGSAPTGTITFNLYGPGDTACASSLASSTATASGDGTYQSAPFAATAAGTYRWVASYGGDAGNEAVSGACGASGESVLVTKASPTVSTTASAGVAVGGQIKDLATLAGGYAETGTVTFSLYGPNDPSCSQNPVAVSQTSVSGDGSYSSSAFTPTQPGTYQWIASYGGDANNSGATGLCGAPNESVTVTAAGPASLSASPSSVAAGGTVTVAFSGVALPTAQDWVGLYPVGAPNGAYVSWFWTSSCTQALGGSGVSAGSCPLVMPATGGQYQLRLFANNTFTVLATSNTVTDAGAPAPTLSASPGSVGPGGTVSVAVGGLVTPSATDWVGLYQTGAANSQYLAFFYTSSCTQTPTSARASATCSFTMPTTPGTYEFRLFSNNSFNLLQTSNTVTVTTPPAASLAVTPSSVASGGTVAVAFANVASPSPTDWVAIYQAGEPAGTPYLDWFYDSSCTQAPGTATGSGSCQYTMPTTPGTYDFVLMANDGNTVLATSNVVTVTAGAAINLTATPSSAGPAGQVTVTWSGVPAPTGADWIGLYATGGVDAAYLGFDYDATCAGNPAASGVSSGSCTFTMPSSDGTYEFRLFANNTFTRLATSGTVTVAG
jgi:6-phosphogluconolactonase (cycloisomerase 2 family)